jgi:hypothetical protein
MVAARFMMALLSSQVACIKLHIIPVNLEIIELFLRVDIF